MTYASGRSNFQFRKKKKKTFRFPKEEQISPSYASSVAILFSRIASGRRTREEIFPTARGKLSPSYSRAHISAHSSFEIALTSDLRTIYRGNGRSPRAIIPFRERATGVTYLHVFAVYIASRWAPLADLPSAISFVRSFARLFVHMNEAPRVKLHERMNWQYESCPGWLFLLDFDASMRR